MKNEDVTNIQTMVGVDMSIQMEGVGVGLRVETGRYGNRKTNIYTLSSGDIINLISLLENGHREFYGPLPYDDHAIADYTEDETHSRPELDPDTRLKELVKDGIREFIHESAEAEIRRQAFSHHGVFYRGGHGQMPFYPFYPGP